jgi:hypothetical protein
VTPGGSPARAAASSAKLVLGALCTLCTLCMLGAACGRAHAPDPLAVGDVASERAPARALGPPARDPRALEGYPPPAAPAPPGCTLVGEWAATQPHELRFRPQGKPFAMLHDAKRAELRLPEGGAAPGATTARTAFVELGNDGARAWGIVPGDALVLHAGRPLLLAGWAAPGAKVPLRWLGSTPGKVEVELVLPKHVTAKTPPSGERLCDDLSLGGATFQPRDAIPAKSTAAAMLPDGLAIALGERLGGPPIAELTFPTDQDPLVDVLARSGTEARVAIFPSTVDPLADVVIVGWVSASLLRPHTHGFGSTWGTGTGAFPTGRRRGGEHWSCAQEVPIVAELEGERRLVGAVAPKMRIDVLAGGTADGGGAEDFVEVSLDAEKLVPAPGARLLVKRAALAECTAQTSP